MIEFVTRERDQGAFLVPVGMLQKRVAAMTGVSERSVQRIASESRKVKRGEYNVAEAMKLSTDHFPFRNGHVVFVITQSA